jgi:hypothetical protein
MALDRRGSLPRVTTKRVSQGMRESVADALRELQRRHPDEKQTRLAKRIGISQPHYSQLLAARESSKGFGVNPLLALREELGWSIDRILGLPPLPEEELLVRIREMLERDDLRRSEPPAELPEADELPKLPPPPKPRS